MELLLKLTGIALIGLSLFHIGFPKQFEWKEELSKLSLINKQLMEVHTFFVALTVLLMGALCIYAATELLTEKLGKIICLGMGIFWLCRLLAQFFGYSSKLWRGKTKETIIHIAFTLIWSYLSFVFLWIGLT